MRHWGLTWGGFVYFRMDNDTMVIHSTISLKYWRFGHPGHSLKKPSTNTSFPRHILGENPWTTGFNISLGPFHRTTRQDEVRTGSYMEAIENSQVRGH